ncbi:MAG: sugar ABC transporter ATP-binding protein [Lachnospiraceae bacterium]|nr:sugar ABC transporter ATP-binding protein [Lachnospiraceae bacterium]MDD3615288.1 sugar ABC transporter ATP-binding protein [Lachnospiraceae bacterium]
MGNASNSESGYALDMRSVSKRFPGTLAVDKVDFQVRAGEVHALMGENGAGKSTLMKMLAGLFNDYTGEIYINGEKRELHSPMLSKEYGVGMVYQELSVARSISIYENLLVGRLPKKNALFIDKKKAIEESKKLLARVGLSNLDPTINVSEISQCDAQLVEIAKVLGNEPKILVLDEPTSALSSEEVQRLFTIVRNLKEQGLAIVYISHHLAEIFEIADMVTVMRDGKKVDCCPIAETNTEKLVASMVGKSVGNLYEAHESSAESEEMLRVEDFTRWGFFHHVNFQLKKGEVLAICGLAGAGRSEIARGLTGIDKINGGKIFMHGKEIEVKNLGDSIRKGIGYLTEDRKVYGLALRQSVGDNISSCIINKGGKGILYNEKNLQKIINEKINEMEVYPADPDRLVNSFSGGNQQKVLMAKWLAAGVDVLILDEPTRGVDIGAKQTIHEVVRNYVSQGHSCILLSSDLPEVSGLADRAIILREGHVIGEIPKAGINENSLLIAANGEGEYVSCQK